MTSVPIWIIRVMLCGTMLVGVVIATHGPTYRSARFTDDIAAGATANALADLSHVPDNIGGLALVVAGGFLLLMTKGTGGTR